WALGQLCYERAELLDASLVVNLRHALKNLVADARIVRQAQFYEDIGYNLRNICCQACKRNQWQIMPIYDSSVAYRLGSGKSLKITCLIQQGQPIRLGEPVKEKSEVRTFVGNQFINPRQCFWTGRRCD